MRNYRSDDKINEVCTRKNGNNLIKYSYVGDKDNLIY